MLCIYCSYFNKGDCPYLNELFDSLEGYFDPCDGDMVVFARCYSFEIK